MRPFAFGDQLPLGLALRCTGGHSVGWSMVDWDANAGRPNSCSAGLAGREGEEVSSLRIVGCGGSVEARGWPTPTDGRAWHRRAEVRFRCEFVRTVGRDRVTNYVFLYQY